ncbi:MAG: hypothetical protein COW67_04230 [Flavobacteriales bacterium CG18_big_fil_WC_8_21_14_2_50_32_9]|nr:MAG: hypothetical protein COW67_04230 [Flavobacteriales bacterium CG18_big_fil_WC_8_21_14_2_50_32_9]PIZ06292.1 MAG: hypothetical protein COY57_02795 [Flavobacteriales bacterium CG_4_10_14_0_8_um_filter_32_5]PJC62442.1 MAG: hypothetical protein CO022_04470 [Flavobacteriales bacterium CG_4_9_14_0_2_um_filter_32_27]
MILLIYKINLIINLHFVDKLMLLLIPINAFMKYANENMSVRKETQPTIKSIFNISSVKMSLK